LGFQLWKYPLRKEVTFSGVVYAFQNDNILSNPINKFNDFVKNPSSLIESGDIRSDASYKAEWYSFNIIAGATEATGAGLIVSFRNLRVNSKPSDVAKVKVAEANGGNTGTSTSGSKTEAGKYYRGTESLENPFEMSAADIRNSVDKTTGFMKERGVSLNLDKNNKFVQSK